MSCQFPGCSKPVYAGGAYCSRTHRDTAPAPAQAGIPNRNPASGLCQFPGCSKPVFPGSDYCTRSHRDNAPKPAPAQSGGQFYIPTLGGIFGSTSNPNNLCQFPDCSKPVYPGSAYCTRTHRDNALKQASLQSGSMPNVPPGMPSDPPGMPSHPPGIRSHPPGMLSDLPGMPSDPPGMPSDPPGMPSNPPGMPKDPFDDLPNDPPDLPNNPSTQFTCKLAGCSNPVFSAGWYCSEDHYKLK